MCHHDDVIKWKYFPRYWPFVRDSPVNSLHKGQWRGALVFSLICAWINGWVNNRETGDLGRHQTHCDVTVMTLYTFKTTSRMHTALDLCFTLKGEPGHEQPRHRNSFSPSIPISTPQEQIVQSMWYMMYGRSVLISPHLPLDKMATFSQTIYSNAFSSINVFWAKLHGFLSPSVP